MKKEIIAVIVILIIIAGFAFGIKSGMMSRKEYGPYDGFIMCLKASGAKFYGDYTDTNTLRQMSLFGDSLGLIETSGIYVECNSRGYNPKVDKCREANLVVYPTWIINGKNQNGIQGFNKLSDLTGCEY